MAGRFNPRVWSALWVVATVCVSPFRVGAAPIDYSGHKVARVRVATPGQKETLKSLNLDVWSCSGNIEVGEVPVRIAPGQMEDLARTNLEHRIWLEDLGPLVADQLRAAGPGFHQAYHTLAEIETQVGQYAAAYPALAQVVDFGTSLENRTMTGLRITGAGNGADKPGLFIFGGQHAREWVGPATMMFIAEQLLAQHGADPLITQLVDEIEWFILPVMNPDGYEFSWTDDRFWRKNRLDNGDGTFGVDLNRNWDYGWGGEGSSGVTSDPTYRGTAPFSEPETQAMRDFVWDHPNLIGFIDFHSYSELILWPWGNTSALPPDQAEFAFIGEGMHDEIFGVHGHSYTYGPIYTTIYPAAGTSADWVYGANLVDRFIAAFAFELRDLGQTGFLLPADQIIPTGEENLAAVLFMAERISQPLRVELVSPVPGSLSPGQSLGVTARVTPRAEDVVADGVVLHYRTDGLAYTPLVMDSLGDDLFAMELPPGECGDSLDFYLLAAGDQGGTTGFPGDAPATALSIPVQLNLLHFMNPVETATGWSVGDVGDSATTGVWVHGNPIGTSAQPEDDHTSDTGVSCFVTGQGTPGGPVGENDVDGGRTTLFSPVFELPADSFRITVALWYQSTDAGAPPADQMTVAVSNNAGSSWTVVETFTATTGGWTLRSYRPIDFGLAATNQMRLRFAAGDFGGGTIVEAAVDDLTVSRPGCPDGDFNGDGDVDLADHLAMAQCLNGPLGATVSAACGIYNFDFDTDVDMADFLSFAMRFGQ